MRRSPAIPEHPVLPALSTLSVALLGLVSVTACDRSPASGAAAAQPAPFDVRAADMDEDDIPDQEVQGELAGERFELQDAVFRTETMARRQRTDIRLWDQEITKCDVPVPNDARKVWIRFPGITDLEVGVHRIEADEQDPEMRVHYELPNGEGWKTSGRAAALLIIDSADEETVLGRLEACFADGQDSCVKGRFVARRCVGPLDVDDAVSGAAQLDPDRPLPGSRPELDEARPEPEERAAPPEEEGLPSDEEPPPSDDEEPELP